MNGPLRETLYTGVMHPGDRLIHPPRIRVGNNITRQRFIVTNHSWSFYAKYAARTIGLILNPRAAELAACRKKCGLAAGRIAASRQPGRNKMRLSRRKNCG